MRQYCNSCSGCIERCESYKFGTTNVRLKVKRVTDMLRIPFFIKVPSTEWAEESSETHYLLSAEF
jgi:hypothetical protein